MIESIKCQNFKVLRNVELSFGAFTLLVGPNGSGKRTLLQAIAAGAFLHNQHAHQVFRQNPHDMQSFLAYLNYPSIASVGSDGKVQIDLLWELNAEKGMTRVNWPQNGHGQRRHLTRGG